MSTTSVNPKPDTTLLECFVIMPVAELEGYAKSHFKHVFDDIISPACVKAGFRAIRADQVKQSNLIHLDILQKLLNTPMAVCDLSSRNPNVLFELALRQAFDKPVALIQELGTPSIFDIAPLRYTEYRKERIYHEVLEDQNAVATTIRETFESHSQGKGINSIVKLLSLSQPAKLLDRDSVSESEGIQQLILAELSRLREEVRSSKRHDDVAIRKAEALKSRVDVEELLERIHNLESRFMHDPKNELSPQFFEMLKDCEYRFNRVQRIACSERENVMLMEIGSRLNRLTMEIELHQKRAEMKSGMKSTRTQ